MTGAQGAALQVAELVEDGITSAAIRAETAGWLRYDLPAPLIGAALRGRYRGQEQKWFLLDFEGADDEIDIARPGGGAHEAEFDDWKWVAPDEVVGLVVPFKRAVYEAVLAEFAPLIGAGRRG